MDGEATKIGHRAGHGFWTVSYYGALSSKGGWRLVPVAAVREEVKDFFGRFPYLRRCGEGRSVSRSSALALGSVPHARSLASRFAARRSHSSKRPDEAHDAIDGDGVTVFIEPLDLDGGFAGFHRNRVYSNTRTGRFAIVFGLGVCCPKPVVTDTLNSLIRRKSVSTAAALLPPERQTGPPARQGRRECGTAGAAQRSRQ